uniref:Chitin-binding type-2 domain-containing protein n=1 Tax=Glossina pallidipes TaxID=7398 RepID=A0A1B0AAW3_GLOPL
MHLNLSLLVALATLLIYSHTVNAVATASLAATTIKPQGFHARAFEANADDDIDEEFETQAQTHSAYRQPQQQHQQNQHYQQQHYQQQQQQQPIYDYSQSEEEQEEPPRQLYQGRQQQQNNYLAINSNKNLQNSKKQSSEEESEEEEEEPDRLSLLLAKSTFNCKDKNSGYYADESLKCEVFHYCQENQRHSWICPEGFTFHQIHLICMPPSSDNICQQSSKFHIVNDYLYKPINLQEHQSKPNVTLRYSERYYPENYYDHERYSDEDEIPRARVQHQRQPVQVGFPQNIQTQHQRPLAQQQQHQLHQQQQQQQQQQQLQQHHQPQPVRHQPQTATQSQALPQTTVYRKPALSHSTTAQPHAPRVPTSVLAVTPTPYRLFTANAQLQHLQQQQQQVYRTPEDINISLQQRRPQIFIGSTTPRYYEDEYLYERK